jgi:hypothetical protein
MVLSQWSSILREIENWRKNITEGLVYDVLKFQSLNKSFL